MVTESTDLTVQENNFTQELVATEDKQEIARHEADAEMKASMILARQFPRSSMVSYGELMESCKRPGFADQVTYTFPRGGGSVSGPSVVLAREAARCWGNIRYGVDVTYDDPHKRKIRAWAWDVQTNTKSSSEDEFEKLIYRKQGGWIKPDERDLRELTNRRAAFAERNCLLKLLPRDIIDDAISTAQTTIKNKVQGDPKGQLKKIIAGFATYNVKPEMIEKYLRHPLDEIAPDEIVNLHGIFQSIKDGNSTVAEYFHQKEEQDGPASAEGTKAPAEALADTPEAKRSRKGAKADTPEAKRSRKGAKKDMLIDQLMSLEENPELSKQLDMEAAQERFANQWGLEWST